MYAVEGRIYTVRTVAYPGARVWGGHVQGAAPVGAELRAAPPWPRWAPKVSRAAVWGLARQGSWQSLFFLSLAHNLLRRLILHLSHPSLLTPPSRRVPATSIRHPSCSAHPPVPSSTLRRPAHRLSSPPSAPFPSPKILQNPALARLGGECHQACLKRPASSSLMLQTPRVQFSALDCRLTPLCPEDTRNGLQGHPISPTNLQWPGRASSRGPTPRKVAVPCGTSWNTPLMIHSGANYSICESTVSHAVLLENTRGLAFALDCI